MDVEQRLGSRCPAAALKLGCSRCPAAVPSCFLRGYWMLGQPPFSVPRCLAPSQSCTPQHISNAQVFLGKRLAALLAMSQGPRFDLGRCVALGTNAKAVAAAAVAWLAGREISAALGAAVAQFAGGGVAAAAAHVAAPAATPAAAPAAEQPSAAHPSIWDRFPRELYLAMVALLAALVQAGRLAEAESCRSQADLWRRGTAASSTLREINANRGEEAVARGFGRGRAVGWLHWLAV